MESSLGSQVPRLIRLETLPPNLQSFKWWIISIPPDKDLIWDIVLAYLITSTSNGSSGTLPIRRLLDRKRVSKDSPARHCVEEYNPFVSSKRSVCSEEMKEIVDEFGKRIDEYVEMNPDSFPSMKDDHKKLEAASVLLSCNILFHCKRKSPGNTTEYSSQWFPRKNPLKAFETTLILLNGFRETEDDVLCKSYSFLLPETNGRIKQKLALGEILKKTKVESETVNVICELENICQDFLCCLLKSDFADSIPLIYKSPYILSKLQDAQFKIDPKQISDLTGETGLYHALELPRTDLLYFLYNQALNDCYSVQGSVRSPNSTIVNNLESLKKKLSEMNDEKIGEEHSYLKKLNEIIRFNEFQNEICRGMLNVLQHPEPDTIVKKAEEAKDVILTIAQTYIKYFNWSNVDDVSGKLTLFKVFCQHKDYFDGLDFCSAVMFFDNIHLLKVHLSLPDKCCSKIESQFFNFVYCRKYYDVNVLNPSSDSKLIVLSKVIMFQERKVWERNLKKFWNVLRHVKVSEGNVREKIPEEEVVELTDHGHIYGQVLLFRLNHYLNAAVSVSINNPMATYTILRALQVLGECVKNSDFKSIQKVLTFSLTEALVSAFKQIRNNLSHLKPRDIVYRKRIEGNLKLLKTIQSDLEHLKNLLTPIYSSYEKAIDFFDLNRSLKAVSRLMNGNIPKKEWNSLKEILPEENIKESKRKIGRGYFNLIRNSLVSKIKRSWSCKTIENNERCYKYLVNNLILNTKKSLKKLNNVDKQLKKSIAYIHNFFWCAEFLLGYLIKDSLLIKHRRKVLKLIRRRREYFGQLGSLKKAIAPNEFVKLTEKMEAFIETYTNVTKEIFASLSVSGDGEPNFPGIEKVCLLLKGKIFLSDKEKDIILRSVSGDFKEIQVAKGNVAEIITDETISLDSLVLWMDRLSLSPSQKQDILQCLEIGEIANALDVVINIKDFYGELEEVLKNDSIDKKRFDILTNKMDFPESSKCLLEKLVQGRYAKDKGNKITFLIDRIKSLEKCLVHSNKEIEFIWKEAKSERKKAYLREKMSELYLNDPTVQAAIEMLLFDCMNILQSKELEYLWLKSERLFKGLYLRNLLAHGKPILEVIGKFLDPEDLPLEIVSKVLQLISDKMALKGILELYNNCNQDYTELCRILKDDEDVRFAELREEIRKSDRWEAYVKLLPRNSAEKN